MAHPIKVNKSASNRPTAKSAMAGSSAKMCKADGGKVHDDAKQDMKMLKGVVKSSALKGSK